MGDRDRDAQPVSANLAVVLLAAAVLVLLMSFLTYRDSRGCSSNAHGLSWTFAPIGGCRYGVGGEYVPAGKLVFLPDGRILMRIDTVSA